MSADETVTAPESARSAGKKKSRFWESARQWVGGSSWPILVLLVANIVVGFYTVQDYGESWDEDLRYKYAVRSLKAYTQRAPETVLEDEKGPAFGMLAYLGGKFWQRLRPDWDFIVGWHFMNFLSFQLGVWGLYLLCRLLLDRPAALGGALLFSTQPLLWGHAFINPKDIPFMAFFIASLAMGIRMVLACTQAFSWRSQARPGIAEAVTSLRKDRQALREKGRLPFLLRLGLLMLVGLVILVIGHFGILAGLRWVISALYFAEPSTVFGQIYRRIAQNVGSVPVESYLHKGTALYVRLLAAYALMTIGINLVNWRLFFRLFFTWCREIVKQISLDCMHFISQTWDKFFWLLGAGVVLGITASIRVLGPLAGLLVAAYFVYKAGRRAWVWLPLYGLLAAITVYYTWPGLWQAPIQHYQRSLSVSANFSFYGRVLFDGRFYDADTLPTRYLPVLMAIQFTEPALILCGLGLVALVWHAWRGRVDRGLLGLLLAWFLLPAVAVVVLHSNLYDNFRHMLFITPSLFVFAGFGLGEVLRWVRLRAWSMLVLVAVILPGVYWDIQLHPYQYVYYNSLVGGVKGAFRRYELDYWATSYQEATEFINQIAPIWSRIYVRGPEHIVSRYARADLLVVRLTDETDLENLFPGYVILSSRSNKDLEYFPDQKPILSIGRRGAVFTVVKHLPMREAEQ